MNQSFVLRTLICFFFLGFSLYSYLSKQNQLTELRLRLPKMVKEIQAIKEENTQLRYAIDQFESPHHLLELARSSAYSHLQYPLQKEILSIQQGVELTSPSEATTPEELSKVKVSLAARPQ